MLLRVGGVFVVTGLALALALGPMLAVVGGVLMVCGRIMLALALRCRRVRRRIGFTLPTTG
jgi:hypothetical protein